MFQPLIFRGVDLLNSCFAEKLKDSNGKFLCVQVFLSQQFWDSDSKFGRESVMLYTYTPFKMFMLTSPSTSYLSGHFDSYIIFSFNEFVCRADGALGDLKNCDS